MFYFRKPNSSTSSSIPSFTLKASSLDPLVRIPRCSCDTIWLLLLSRTRQQLPPSRSHSRAFTLALRTRRSPVGYSCQFRTYSNRHQLMLISRHMFYTPFLFPPSHRRNLTSTACSPSTLMVALDRPYCSILIFGHSVVKSSASYLYHFSPPVRCFVWSCHVPPSPFSPASQHLAPPSITMTFDLTSSGSP